MLRHGVQPHDLRRLHHDVSALISAAGGPLSCLELASALGVDAPELELLASGWPGTVAPDGSLDLGDAERRRRYAKLSPERRTWAHRLLASVRSDPTDRVRHACRAGCGRQALDLLREVEARCDLPAATRCELRRSVLAAGPGRPAARRLHRELAHLAWATNQVDEAEASLRAAGASERARDGSLRLLWAHIHNRRGQFSASLALTRSLLRASSASGADDGEIIDLHARNLLLLGKADEALCLLDARLRRPDPDATQSELKLHLTRERCAREAAAGAPGGQRLLDLARVVSVARRRRAKDIEAQAAFRVGVALSDRGDHTRALRWLQRARAAWLILGDVYRAAEVENSLGIVLKNAGQLANATAQFEQAIARLETLNERQAVGVVRLNLADLRMDMLELGAARAALAFCREQLEQGILRHKSELMHVECLLLEGAAPDVLLGQLEALGSAIAEIDRPAVQAYFHLLRGRLLRQSGRSTAAALALQRAADLYTRSGQPAAAASSMVEWAALQDDPGRLRSGLARALLLARRQPAPLVAHAHAALRGRPRPPMPPLKLLGQRIGEACRAIETRCSATDGATAVDPAHESLLAAARLVARWHPDAPPEGMLDYCREHLRADRFFLRRAGPVGSSSVIASHELSPRDLRDTRLASRLVVEARGFELGLAHSTVVWRFGGREERLALQLLDLLAARTEARAPGHERAPAPAAAPRTGYEPDGVSSFVRRVALELPVLAASDLALVLEGPTGSGKDRLARHIHALSLRARGPYVVVDCGALHEGLLESELVGHARGAFTGAAQARVGLIELASSGTLVLDEPASLPPRAQALFIHVLEHGTVRRLGDSIERRVEPRILSLTRQPLSSHVQRGTLRSELYYRLLGSRFELMPLRERLEDLPVLLASLIESEGAGHRRAFDPAALATLAAEPWPGNVTELRNRVRRALLLEPGSGALSARALGSDTAEAEEPSKVRLPDLLREEERRVLLSALSQNGGHRERTANELGITRRWLQKRIKALGLS